MTGAPYGLGAWGRAPDTLDAIQPRNVCQALFRKQRANGTPGTSMGGRSKSATKTFRGRPERHRGGYGRRYYPVIDELPETERAKRNNLLVFPQNRYNYYDRLRPREKAKIGGKILRIVPRGSHGESVHPT